MKKRLSYYKRTPSVSLFAEDFRAYAYGCFPSFELTNVTHTTPVLPLAHTGVLNGTEDSGTFTRVQCHCGIEVNDRFSPNFIITTGFVDCWLPKKNHFFLNTSGLRPLSACHSTIHTLRYSYNSTPRQQSVSSHHPCRDAEVSDVLFCCRQAFSSDLDR